MATTFENYEGEIIDAEMDANLRNEEWQKRRLARNARRRERRQERKEEDPEFLKRENEKRVDETKKRQERRKQLKEEDPESHARFLKSEKQKRINQQRKIINEIMEKLYFENKHTFPFPVSKSRWENLKKEELDWMFVFNPLRLTLSELSVRSFMEERQNQLEDLKENPDHGAAGSMIFFVKTMVHNPRDQRKLTEEEKIWIKNFHLDLPEKEESKYFYDQTEYKKEKRKIYYNEEKLSQKSINLNRRFIKADPNKVLSIDEITNNPYVSNFSLREQYKIDLWKEDKNLENLKKWREQREDYEKEVEKLSVEYKENFIKINGGSNISRDI